MWFSTRWFHFTVHYLVQHPMVSFYSSLFGSAPYGFILQFIIWFSTLWSIIWFSTLWSIIWFSTLGFHFTVHPFGSAPNGFILQFIHLVQHPMVSFYSSLFGSALYGFILQFIIWFSTIWFHFTVHYLVQRPMVLFYSSALDGLLFGSAPYVLLFSLPYESFNYIFI